MAQSGGGVAGKPTPLPNLDAESTRTHNLTVLQRFDTSIEEILFTAAHVTLYDFNIDLNQWSRKDVEGSLFVVKRNAQPRFQFIVMNRRNAANLVENILGDFEYDLKVPYLLYRNASQEVTGIWFYNSSECEAVSSLFSRIIGAFSKVPTKPKGSLNKRESDGSGAVQGMTTAESPLKPPATSTPTIAAPRNGTGSNSIANIPHQQQQLHPTSGLPSSQCRSAEPSCISTLQTPSPLTTSTSSVTSLPSESTAKINGHHSANLLKPSHFSPANPPSSSMAAPIQPSPIPSASTFEPSFTLQQPNIPKSLHPFPPPISALGTSPSNHRSIITRDKVREALSRLAQNDQFVDMVYGEILNALHHL